MPFDSTGKISFDDIYTEPDPRAYFGTLGRVDYQIPQLAKPYFTKLIKEYRAERGVAEPTVLDIGCSYGVNAALQRCDATMDELYDYYTSPDARTLDHEALVSADRHWVRAHEGSDDIRFIGLDNSEPALTYARSAGFIDDAIHADLEREDPAPEQQNMLAGVDLVISTGCVGYVTERTIARIARGARPWMAHFVLRMFSYDPVATRLAELGYETAGIEGVFRQRRFTSAQEQSQILDTLSSAGVDSDGLETEGWLYAQLYISRPAGAARQLACAMNTVSPQ
ncbi:class I SAM-dependent methyltransferase [Amycolatopsis alkalitolerans]|uniref:Class I SAM-dependent methyltransferase n=1 Tax=Amycolatopsis alkalitolerans TaxID=2547244 RepID=A0A5C4LTQ2_9PSEU|nr:class I SAM-dependent methyltransferase [Amycolatopsis alkalitolerans]TNC21310.1 class I SAM-dependent methyltransferase [Amycolatopsis alkalitolerans]